MSSAESGSLGLVLLAHTARCLVTILSHCIELLYANLHLIVLGSRSCFLATRIVYHSVFESVGIILASSGNTITAWQVTFSVFLWTIPYIIFLSFVLLLAAVVVILERCETVYLHLRSSRFETAIRGYLAMSPLARPSQGLLGPSAAAMDRILSVPKQSPSFRASTTKTTKSQSCHNRFQRTLKEITIGLLNQIDTAVTSSLPEQIEELEPPNAMRPTSNNPQGHRNHPSPEKELYKVSKATNVISLLRDGLLSKIVECWERFPTPTLTLRAFHLQMKPVLSRVTKIETRKINRSTAERPVSTSPHMEHATYQPASPMEDPFLATRLLPAPPSQQ